MTRWERWLSQQKGRKTIICSVYDYNDTGRCGEDCLLYPICQKHYETIEEFHDAYNEYLDSEEVPTREAVITNLSAMIEEAREHGYDGYVKTMSMAIELLKEK